MLDRLLVDLAPHLPLLMNDKYANHVFQRMIDFSDAEQQQQLKDGLLPHADILNPNEVCFSSALNVMASLLPTLYPHVLATS